MATLTPGNYTAIVNGNGGTTGIGLVEVYELDSTSRLLNISTRGFAGAGDNVMIAGLILNGTDNGTICFRALGPSLAAFGVQGVNTDPRLDLFNAQGTKVGANNNWRFAAECYPIGRSRSRERYGIGTVDQPGARQLYRDRFRNRRRNRRRVGRSLSASLTWSTHYENNQPGIGRARKRSS